jgi:tryptophan synthase alpha chain
VPLLAPTSTDARIELACQNAGGFIYLVSVAGTTGARAKLGDRVADLVARTRSHTSLPLIVGFGISTPEHARAALEAGADGVIIGTRAIQVAEEGGAAALHDFVANIARALL